MLIVPKFKRQGFEYFDEETQKYKLKEDAPQWAEEEFKEYIKDLEDMVKESEREYKEKGVVMKPSLKLIKETLSNYI